MTSDLVLGGITWNWFCHFTILLSISV